MTVNDCLLEIARIDKALREYVTSRTVIKLNDLHIKSLKEARRLNVRQIQNYKPRETC